MTEKKTKAMTKEKIAEAKTTQTEAENTKQRIKSEGLEIPIEPSALMDIIDETLGVFVHKLRITLFVCDERNFDPWVLKELRGQIKGIERARVIIRELLSSTYEEE